jgi:hypothetical protein
MTRQDTTERRSMTFSSAVRKKDSSPLGERSPAALPAKPTESWRTPSTSTTKPPPIGAGQEMQTFVEFCG